MERIKINKLQHKMKTKLEPNRSNSLKIRLFVWHRTVLMEILEQTELFTPKGDDIIEFKSSNGMSILSAALPQLGHESVYLRGKDKEEDFKVCLKCFPTQKKAEEYKNKVLIALSEWATRYPFSNAALHSSDSKYTDLYTF